MHTTRYRELEREKNKYYEKAVALQLFDCSISRDLMFVSHGIYEYIYIINSQNQFLFIFDRKSRQNLKLVFCVSHKQ